MDKQAPRKTLTVHEAVKELGLSVNATYVAVKEGKIPSLRIGKRIIIPRAAFDRLLEPTG